MAPATDPTTEEPDTKPHPVSVPGRAEVRPQNPAGSQGETPAGPPTDTCEPDGSTKPPRWTFRRFLGLLLILFGIPLYLLPLPFGLAAFAVGIGLLGGDFPPVRRLLAFVRRSSPALYRRLCDLIRRS